jgi:hypothetical protein
MTPWTREEIQSLTAFIAPDTLLENPLDRNKSFLSEDFYSGSLPGDVEALVPMRVTARSDDKPYFNFVRKDFMNERLPDPTVFVDDGMAKFSNQLMRNGVPMDVIHLVLVAAAALVFVVGFVIVPLRFAKIPEMSRKSMYSLLVYFSCLGGGFIIVELTLIQKFMHLIGSPLYTYSAVICSMLIGAGIGSSASERLGIDENRRWSWPFIAAIVFGIVLACLLPYLFDLAIGLATPYRILLSALTILPMGFFLGMPFPIGILALRGSPRGAIAWAWGMNGVFTIIGGLGSVVLSLALGFTSTLIVAVAIYGIALLVFPIMRVGLEQTRDDESRFAEAAAAIQ